MGTAATSGATAATGGATAAPGGTSAIGTHPNGGVTGSAGGTPTGGAVSAGGVATTGGAAATGGVQSNGGAPSSGGSPATGGAQGTGGTKATGGVTAGGSSSTGGSITTGGTSSTVGTKQAGGSSSTGGTKATGGLATTGGSSATGGTTATAGTANCTTPPDPSALIGWASVSGNGVTTTTGGGNATPTVVTTLAALNTAAGGTTARVIYVQGNLSGTVSIGSNKTIVGICGATITGHIAMTGSVNVIFRNIKVVGLNCTDSPSDCSAGADGITVVNSAHHIWFDHVDVSDGSDGNLDITQASDFVTVSWSKFSYSSKRTDPAAGASGHRFSNLIGASDNNSGDVGKLNVTWHHVWWADNVDQRMPRVRYGKIHVFNSLYTTTGNNYCIGIGMAASMRDENNVFIGSTRPVNSGSFSDATTTLISIGNIYANTTGGAAADIPTAFTPTYQYTLDAAASVQAAVQAGVGPK